MKRWAVGVYTVFDGEHVVKIVEAEDPYHAVLLAVEETEIPTDEDGNEITTVEDLLQYYWNADISVSQPVPID